MDLNIVESKDESLLLEIKGETVTVTNVLKSELWDDESVSESAQIKEHPYLENPKIFVKTSKGKPQAALEKAAERVEKQADEFSEEFKKALKK